MTKKLNTLADLNIGDSGVVKGYLTKNHLTHQLREMGLTQGVTIKVKKIAPLGDPYEFELRNFRLSLRKKDAQAILLEPC